MTTELAAASPSESIENWAEEVAFDDSKLAHVEDYCAFESTPEEFLDDSDYDDGYHTAFNTETGNFELLDDEWQPTGMLVSPPANAADYAEFLPPSALSSPKDESVRSADAKSAVQSSSVVAGVSPAAAGSPRDESVRMADTAASTASAA